VISTMTREWTTDEKNHSLRDLHGRAGEGPGQGRKGRHYFRITPVFPVS